MRAIEITMKSSQIHKSYTMEIEMDVEIFVETLVYNSKYKSL